MPRRGKNYRRMMQQVDRTQEYEGDFAIEMLKKVSFARFDETVEVAVNLGVNPRHADQMVRSAVVLPHGLGKSVTVIVFAKGDKAKEAEAAGADYVGGDDLIRRIRDDGWLGFDKAIATPDMMGLVGRIGRILGPRGLMPNPKVGTVTFNVTQAIKEMKAGRVEFRVDKAGIVHAPIGKLSFGTNALVENLHALIEILLRLRPASAKGVYMKNVTVSSTMGTGLRLDCSLLQQAVKK